MTVFLLFLPRSVMRWMARGGQRFENHCVTLYQSLQYMADVAMMYCIHTSIATGSFMCSTKQLMRLLVIGSALLDHENVFLQYTVKWPRIYTRYSYRLEYAQSHLLPDHSDGKETIDESS